MRKTKVTPLKPKKKVIPKSETELKAILDKMYLKTKSRIEENKLPKFYNLIEIMTSEATIKSAIHKIKSNGGSKTPGTDGTVIDEILQSDYDSVIDMVKQKLTDPNYELAPIKRVHIPKPGSKEKRPLGIPSITDRIVQQVVKMVIEPIFEAQFFKHSYGFRPMRDAEQAIARIENMMWNGYNWVIEGDISKFFDKVNHRILTQKMWHLGIRDKRVLKLVNKMLKAKIMDEIKPNELGTPQGGIISPLLANIYLHSFDEWLTREWEEKTNIYMKSKNAYRNEYQFDKYGNKIPVNNLKQAKNNIKEKTNVKPFFLVRYADDWVILTKSKEHAEKLLYKVEKYLNEELKLQLSKDKTVITNVRIKPITFLGFKIKMIKGKSETGYVVRSKPVEEKFHKKIIELRKEIKMIRKCPTKMRAVEQIQKVNSTIRGLINYYEIGSATSLTMLKYSRNLQFAGFRTLKEHNPKWIPAKQTLNLKKAHEGYNTAIPSIKIDGGEWLGITSLGFVRHNPSRFKNQEETPYTVKGRLLYEKRTEKKRPLNRPDEFFPGNLTRLIYSGKTKSLYNFEYFLNREYALNRDKFACKCCKKPITPRNVEMHHKSPKLELTKVNKLNNLATVCEDCHTLIHSNSVLTVSKMLSKETIKRIQKYRNELEKTG